MVKAGHTGTPLVSQNHALHVMQCYDTVVIATSILVSIYVSAESGLRGTELRIDCTVSDGPCCSAHVVTYAEAKFTLISKTDQAEAVGQLWVSILSKQVAVGIPEVTSRCTMSYCA